MIIVAVIVEALLLSLLLAIAAGKHLRMQELDAELAAARIRAEEAEAWCELWEKQAEGAAEEAENATRQHAELQALYCRLVREQLAANWPLVLAYRGQRRSE